jgi:hypothetical protein
MGLGKRGRLRVDQPTITGELGPAPDANIPYSPVMIAPLSKDRRPERCDEGGGLFFCKLPPWALEAQYATTRRRLAANDSP